MRMKCDIIQDLIPVYYDGIASDATCTEMRLHLKNCPECRQYYAQYRRSMQIELAAESAACKEPASDSFANLSRRVRRRKLLSAASVTAIAAVAAAAIVYSVCREFRHMTNE